MPAPLSSSRLPLLVAVGAVACGLMATQILSGHASADLQGGTFEPYKDVDAFSLEGKAALSMREQGIMIGYSDNTFGGAQSINRAQAAKILLLSGKKQLFNMRNAGIFTDVLDGQWYTQYVLSAAMHEIIKGYPDQSFHPNNPVNTAEFIKMLAIVFDLPSYMPHSYLDVSPSDWFNRYAGAAQKYDLFPLRPRGRLQGSAWVTRREAAIAIYQIQHASRSSVSSSSSVLTLTKSSASASSPIGIGSSASDPVLTLTRSSSSASSSGDDPVLRRSSSSASSAGCYFAPTPPQGCLYVCEKNVLCLKESQCQLKCASSSSSSHS
jgi:hypothetical protein